MCFSGISSLLIVFWFIIALELESTALAALESRIFQGEYAEESLLLSAHLTQVGFLAFPLFSPITWPQFLFCLLSYAMS